VKLFWVDTEPFLRAVYAFGEVLDGADPLDAVQVAVAINLPPEEVPWESTPEGAEWLADELRLSKGGFLYFWRSYLDPASDPADERLQLRDDLDAALAHLRAVRDKYWDHDWRREHRGYGRYPENELWEAVEGYLDLVDASRSSKAGGLPGPGGWSVAVQDLGPVLVPGGGGAVRVHDQGPAALVDHHLVVIKAQEYAAGQAGLTAVGLVLDVVDLAGSSGLAAAARPLAVPAAMPDRVADVGGDGVAVADVQGQAGPAQPEVAELLPAQERAQPAGTG
jgi:hypothetical protein